MNDYNPLSPVQVQDPEAYVQQQVENGGQPPPGYELPHATANIQIDPQFGTQLQQQVRQGNMYGLHGQGQTGMLGMGGTRRFQSPMHKMLNPMAPGVSGPGMNGAGVMQRAILQQNGGVAPGHYYGPNAVQAAQAAGPNIDQIRADMARHNMGAQMGPQNAALSGYMMAK